MLAGKQTTSISYGDIKGEIQRGIKDKQVMATAFDIATQLLQGSTAKQLNIGQKIDAFFVDYDILPLLMQEGYINSIGSGWRNADENTQNAKLEALKKCSQDFVQADIISTTLRKVYHTVVHMY
eukprot:GHVS01062868.1.p1 GENE.GHVS01062868.1~~GHVS01062868.1.p1  ORF type:complete len:124 (-),score=14.25 GHVS01062868.1:690-1061(-)